MKFTLMLLIAVSAAHAEPDPKAVQFTGEIVSKAPYQVRFHAPAGHHFNEEAPAKVEMDNDGQMQPGQIQKSPQTMTVNFNEKKIAADCRVQAQLFVCNEGNTYCRNVREEFDCQKLKLKN